MQNIDKRARALLFRTRLARAMTRSGKSQAALAREAGIERIVYLSVIHSDLYVNVPHFAGKYGVERMIEEMEMHATILRPAYFMDNEVTIKDWFANQQVG